MDLPLQQLWLFRDGRNFWAALVALFLAACAAPALSPDAEAERKMLELNENARSHEVKGQFRDAIQLYHAAIELKPVPADLGRSKARRWVQNNLAWLLATCPDGSIRNGSRALQLAEQLVAAKPKYPPFLDTLAAAQAEMRQFSKAVKTEQQALILLPAGHPLRNSYLQHLLAYKDKKPWRKP